MKGKYEFTELSMIEKYLRRISWLLAIMIIPVFIIAGYYTWDIYPRIKWSFRDPSRSYQEANELLYEKRYQEVIDLSKNMVSEDLNDGQAYFYLGQAYFRLERWEESAIAMKRTLDLHPERKEQIELYLEAIEKKINKED